MLMFDSRWLGLVVAACFGFAAGAHASDWPQWRGPKHNGISDATGLPTAWNDAGDGKTENVVWKIPLPSWSGGTPIVTGDRIFVTSPSKPETPAEPQNAAEPETERDEGAARPQRDARQRAEGGQQDDRPRGERRERGGRGRRGGVGRGGRGGTGGRDPGGQNLLLLCLSTKDGNVLWERQIDVGNRMFRKGNNTSPSPVTDGEKVWVVTGTGAIAAFDLDGKELWKQNLQKEYGEFGLNWGYASSPLLHEGKLVIEVLHGNNTDDPSYVVAFEADTGKVAWRVERPTDAVAESPDAYTTPTVLARDGKTQIVISGGDYVTGHDPATGKELWRAAGLNPRKARNYRIIASPVAVDGMVYAPTRKTPLLALRAGGSGDVTESHLAWKWEGPAAPDVPTPVCDGKRFFMVDDRGLVTCLDAKTGEVIWGPERTALGTVSASPLLADGKLYITNEDGVTTVVAAGDEFEVLATNEVERAYTLSSLAVAGSDLFLRTGTHLYRIGATKE